MVTTTEMATSDITLTCVRCGRRELIPMSYYENDAALAGWYLKTEEPETWECDKCVGAM